METNDELVDYLVERDYIKTGRVEEAFRNVDRAVFVPEQYQNQAYNDTALPIAGEATISAPHMVAINTELLEVEKSSRVLEIGSGSGYQIAILAELTDKDVKGVEIIEELVKKSRERLAKRENVDILDGSGFEPVESEFDRILYSCAIDSFTEAKKHLAENGIAVAPINTNGIQVLKKLEGSEVTEHGRVRFVPFVEDER